MKSTPRRLLDANIIIRFFRQDNLILSKEAANLFDEAEQGKVTYYIDEVVVAEVIWVLTSVYKQKRDEIALSLEKLLAQQWIVSPRKSMVFRALQTYQESNIDYIDCWLLAVSKDERIPIETFDKKLKKLSL